MQKLGQYWMQINSPLLALGQYWMQINSPLLAAAVSSHSSMTAMGRFLPLALVKGGVPVLAAKQLFKLPEK